MTLSPRSISFGSAIAAICCCVAAGVLKPVCCLAAAPEPAAKRQVIVFLGDSITDGFTQPTMIQQALVDAGKPAPVMIDAGVASDTSAQMLSRMDVDVFPYKPDLVVLLAGANDAMQKLSVDVYKANVDGIAKALSAQHIPLIVMTPTTFGPAHQDAELMVDQYADAIHALAQPDGFTVAELLKAAQDARTQGHPVNGPDGVHINYEGNRVMARVVLDAMGDAKIPVPAILRPTPYPGIVSPIFVHPIPAGATPMDDADAQAAVADATWTSVSLPIGTVEARLHVG